MPLVQVSTSLHHFKAALLQDTGTFQNFTFVIEHYQPGPPMAAEKGEKEARGLCPKLLCVAPSKVDRPSPA